MPPVDRSHLFMAIRLAALDLLVTELVRRSPELRHIVEALDASPQELGIPGGIAGKPEVTALLHGELQDAWKDLLQRALSPPG